MKRHPSGAPNTNAPAAPCCSISEATAPRLDRGKRRRLQGVALQILERPARNSVGARKVRVSAESD